MNTQNTLLAVFAGTRAELYSGLAAVIVGGMIVSILFTLVLTSCLLQFSLATYKSITTV